MFNSRDTSDERDYSHHISAGDGMGNSEGLEIDSDDDTSSIVSDLTALPDREESGSGDIITGLLFTEVNRIKDTITELSTIMGRKEAVIDVLTRDLTQTQADLRAERMSVTELTTTVNNLQNQLAALHGDVHTTGGHVDTIRTTVTNEITTLREDLTHASSIANRADGKADRLRHDVDNHSSRCDTIETDLTRVEGKADTNNTAIATERNERIAALTLVKTTFNTHTHETIFDDRYRIITAPITAPLRDSRASPIKPERLFGTPRQTLL